MTETGRIVEILEVKQGQNARTGNMWKSQSFVIDLEDRYNTKICFNIFGADKVDMARLRVGEKVTVVAFAESHKYENNWFTELRCTDIIDNGLSRFVQPMFKEQIQ